MHKHTFQVTWSLHVSQLLPLGSNIERVVWSKAEVNAVYAGVVENWYVVS